MARYTVRQIQEALVDHGFNVGVDGVMGPQTERAISDFKGNNGLLRRPLIGPLTIKLLFDVKKIREPRLNLNIFRSEPVYPPWVNELGRHMHWHEVRDNIKLQEWLRSDGATLGDPAKLPWCGDAMATAIRLTLPKEPFPGALGENPYWARNWVLLGDEHLLALGVMIVATRNGGGHIGTAVGYDPDRRRIRVRGGNQSNSINDTWLDEGRIIGYRSPMNAEGYRKPKTWKHKLPPIPIMNSAGQVVSKNEA